MPSACASSCATSGWRPATSPPCTWPAGSPRTWTSPTPSGSGSCPPVAADRVVQHGNASVRGAAALLLSRRSRARLRAFVGRIEHVELEAEPDFFDLFVDGLRFDPLPSNVETPPT